ncbi:MAG: LacI family transcriptional regulator [Clostridium sp.]|nr:LacI family transcriptional regulator [Clostridium sp.]
MNNTRVTLKDIANECGYTANTVSRAMRNDPHLPPATRQMIRETAERLGYIPNKMASSLRSGKSHVVAVIVNDLHNQHFCQMLGKMDAELQKAGYCLLILCMQLNEELAQQLINTAISLSVDGILYFPHMRSQTPIESMMNNHMPFVLLDRWVQDLTADSVRCDDENGGYLAGRHLAQLGHRRYLYLSGLNLSSSQVDRLAGFKRAMKEYGIPDENIRIVPGEQAEDALSRGCVADLLYPLDYTAIVSFRDELAYPAVSALRERGLSIPGDISVISFDNLSGGNPNLLPLTSIYAAESDVASEGVKILLERIDDPQLPQRTKILPVRIYNENATTGPAAGQ